MPFLNEVGLQTFWDICKQKFAKALGIETESASVTVELKAADSEETVLASGVIPQATQTTAGVMSGGDKAKLDSVANNATANEGTITEIRTSSPITGGPITSGSITIGHAVPGESAAGSVGPVSDSAPGFGESFTVPYIRTNSTGHVADKATHTITLPDNTATTSTKGLMSSGDKTKLDGIQPGATNSSGTITGITVQYPIAGGGTEGSVTILHNASGVTPGAYGDVTNTPSVDLNFGDDFKTTGYKVDSTGHIWESYSHTVRLPSNTATTAVPGLMSAADKEILNSLNPSSTIPTKIQPSSSRGTSTSFARGDHTHGIDVLPGDQPGQIKVGGVSAEVNGWDNFAVLDSNNKIPAANLPSTYGSTTFYATCATSASTAVKIASIYNYGQTGTTYSLVQGHVIYVYFENGNTFPSSSGSTKLQLNIDGTGTKDICFKSNVVSYNNFAYGMNIKDVYWPNDTIVQFRYTGSVYDIVGVYQAHDVDLFDKIVYSTNGMYDIRTSYGTNKYFSTLIGVPTRSYQSAITELSKGGGIISYNKEGSTTNTYLFLGMYNKGTDQTPSMVPRYDLGKRRNSNVADTVGTYSFIEGENTLARGPASHAEGNTTTAYGSYSHAEGYSTTAGLSTQYSQYDAMHAEGLNTTATGLYGSHSEGYQTTASGVSSHAEGRGTVASGQTSHAQNLQTIAASNYQTAIGKNNIEDTEDKYALIVGNGTATDARSNALTVDWEGRMALNNIEFPYLPSVSTPSSGYSSDTYYTTTASDVCDINTTNVTLSSFAYVERFGVAQININFTNKSAISVSTTFNITNVVVATLKPGFRPLVSSSANANGDGVGIWQGNIVNNGRIDVGGIGRGTTGTVSVAAGSIFNLFGTYIVNKNTSA